MGQREDAVAEQQAAKRIDATVERIAHWKMLREKFGLRSADGGLEMAKVGIVEAAKDLEFAIDAAAEAGRAVVHDGFKVEAKDGSAKPYYLVSIEAFETLQETVRVWSKATEAMLATVK
jgi:hypothetical protein